jgi:predicted nucleic acid-binding protein
VAYWDTSALVKLYVTEADSSYFLQLISKTDEPIISSALATTEALCVFYRKEHALALKSGGARRIYRKFRTDVAAGRITTIPYGSDVEAESERVVRLAFVGPHPVLLRSLDVIHVASALVGRVHEIVTTDVRLREVAALVGLKVAP